MWSKRVWGVKADLMCPGMLQALSMGSLGSAIPRPLICDAIHYSILMTAGCLGKILNVSSQTVDMFAHSAGFHRRLCWGIALQFLFGLVIGLLNQGIQAIPSFRFC